MKSIFTSMLSVFLNNLQVKISSSQVGSMCVLGKGGGKVDEQVSQGEGGKATKLDRATECTGTGSLGKCSEDT